jgi:Protein of unknown function (DUF3352)
MTGASSPGAPIQPVASRAGWRWLVGIGIAVAVIVAAIAAFAVLGGPQTPEALRYVPGDAVAVAELRLDLPGDQMQRVGNLLAHFPGFKDQSTLPQKIDETLNQLVGSLSGGSVSYATDLAPWLNGPTFVAARPGPPTVTGLPPGLVSATTNGAVDCAAVFAGETVSQATYRGLDLTVSSDGRACVAQGRQVLLGDVASVRAGLDAHADGTSVDTTARYRSARSALGGDRLATLFLTGAAGPLLDNLPAGSLPFGSSALPLDLSAVPLGLGAGPLPDWTMAGLRAEDDALVLDVVAAPTTGPAAASGATAAPSRLTLPPVGPAHLAASAPADAVLMEELQGGGPAIENALAALAADPAQAQNLQSLDAALGTLGGPDALVGWIDDLGILAVPDGASVDAGLLLEAPDEATAARNASTVATFLNFAPLAVGGVTVSTSTIDGATVTTAVIADLSTLLPQGSTPGLSIPAGSGPLAISVASKGRLVIVGAGEAFVRAVLDVQPGASLADSAGFQRATGRGLGPSRSLTYVGGSAALDWLETLLPADIQARWSTDFAPYAKPLESLLLSAGSGGEVTRARLVLSVTSS